MDIELDTSKINRQLEKKWRDQQGIRGIRKNDSFFRRLTLVLFRSHFSTGRARRRKKAHRGKYKVGG